VDDVDAGTYLTQRLRTTAPETFERELLRTTRRALRRGIVIGSAGSILTLLIALVGVEYFSPGLPNLLLANIGYLLESIR
jgi:hypothetical protein